MIIFDNNNNNKKQLKTTEAQRRANKKYNMNTYKNKTVYIKLTDVEKIEGFLQEHNMSATQYFYQKLREDNVDV